MAKYGRSVARGRAKAALDKSKERPSVEEVARKEIKQAAEERDKQKRRDAATTEIIERTQGRAARFVDFIRVGVIRD